MVTGLRYLSTVCNVDPSTHTFSVLDPSSLSAGSANQPGLAVSGRTKPDHSNSDPA
jgi:hypothetical protein